MKTLSRMTPEELIDYKNMIGDFLKDTTPANTSVVLLMVEDGTGSVETVANIKSDSYFIFLIRKLADYLENNNKENEKRYGDESTN